MTCYQAIQRQETEVHERLGPCCAFWYFKVLSTGLSQYVAEIWLEIWNTVLQAADLCKELNTQPFPLRFAQSTLGASGQAGQRNIPTEPFSIA